MKRGILIALSAGVLTTAGCATRGMYYGAGIEISNAPPPPHIHFGRYPSYSVFHGVRIVEYPDCDLFAYGGHWYAYSDGYWYRARSYNGPYAVIGSERVPDRIFRVPEKHWRRKPHGGPPGHTGEHRGRRR